MRISVKIDNVYEFGGTIPTSVRDAVVPRPGADLDTWAFDALFPLTGTGRPEGNAAYFVTVTACSERPDLVGREFEFGL